MNAFVAAAAVQIVALLCGTFLLVNGLWPGSIALWLLAALTQASCNHTLEAKQEILSIGAFVLPRGAK